LVSVKFRRSVPGRKVLQKRISNPAAGPDTQKVLTIKRRRGEKVTLFFTFF
jgi:hypothetical protein